MRAVQPVMRGVMFRPAHPIVQLADCQSHRCEKTPDGDVLTTTLTWDQYWSINRCISLLLLLCFLMVGRAGQPAAQLSEKSLAAESASITLESLQPDTEYVISLYPLFPRNSASPSILNARTCKSTQRRHLCVWEKLVRPASLRAPLCSCFCLFQCVWRLCSSYRWKRCQRAACGCGGGESAVYGPTVWSGVHLQVCRKPSTVVPCLHRRTVQSFLFL